MYMYRIVEPPTVQFCLTHVNVLLGVVNAGPCIVNDNTEYLYKGCPMYAFSTRQRHREVVHSFMWKLPIGAFRNQPVNQP